MIPNIKKIHPLRWVALVFFSAVVIVACNNESDEAKPAEEAPIEMKVDSLPPLDKTDSVTTTAPETIKN